MPKRFKNYSLFWLYYVKLTYWNLWELSCSDTMYVHSKGSSWSWSYDSCIKNYPCNQCLSPLKLWVRIPLMARWTRYNIMWYMWLRVLLFPPPMKLPTTI